MKELASDLGKIDTRITHQIETEKKYWINVLTRVCSVVKSLASHRLPFRGDEDKFGSSTSKSGNFTMAMELIAEYDPFLSEHISKHGNPKAKVILYTYLFLLTNSLLKLCLKKLFIL